MHLLMPLMDATKMGPLVPAITATLQDSTSLDESSTYSTTSIVICMLYAMYTIAISCRSYQKNLLNYSRQYFFLFVLLLNTHYMVKIRILLGVILLLYFVVYLLAKILLKVQCNTS